jgi:hypothetical protein
MVWRNSLICFLIFTTIVTYAANEIKEDINYMKYISSVITLFRLYIAHLASPSCIRHTTNI